MIRPLVTASIVAVCAMVAAAAMPSRVAQPEARTGSIRGEVRDAGGRPMPGAVVEASHEAGAWRTFALTDKQGVFTLAGVPPGSVTLVARRGAFEFSAVARVVAGAEASVVIAPSASIGSSVVTGSGRYVGGAPAPLPAPAVPGGVLGQSVGAVPRTQERMVGRVAHHLDTWPPTSMDAYARVDPSGYRRVGDAPLSTFSIDVDTASYTNARRFLMEGSLPPADAVRVEEWINYFPYAYPAPEGADAFRVSTALTTSPWNPKHQLLRVGVRGRAIPPSEPPARNLVFLVDVSGSMMPKDRLPLVKTALRMLTDQLAARDRIALVVYAGRSGLVLPSTPGDQKSRIHDALARLEAGGSTNGAGGIQLAYQTAHEGFIKGGVNRVVLATDGDFNVGITSLGDLTRLVEDERGRGVFLSVLGVGRGNLKDATLEQLADRGNGNYAYIDSLAEARRVLVEQVGATLVTIAKDVKLQVEFNPRHVAAYRLIGYENRALQTEDFADDTKDAGEIGAGHTVTALYEIVPPGREGDLPGATPLRYQQTPAPKAGRDGELATVSIRHKTPDGSTSRLQAHPVSAQPSAGDPDTTFAAAVAEAALVLRKDPLATGASLAAAARRAESATGADPGGWRAEFVRLMGLAASLQAYQSPQTSEQ